MSDRAWAQVPIVPGDARSGGPALGVAALVVLSASGLLWWGGHPRRAAILLAVGGTAAVVAAVQPRVRRAAAAVADRLGHGAGVVLGVVLLVPAYYLVLTPLGWLLRAIGARPLDTASDAGRASYWTARAAGVDERPARLYTDQRGWQPLGTSRRGRRRAVAGAVLATLLVEAAVAGGWLLVQARDQPPDAPPSGVSSVAAPQAGALRDLPWVEAAYADQTTATNGLVYAPFVESAIRDVETDTFNVRDRVRRSYETPLAEQQEPIDVWFFGGSTMFGFDLQRDLHTIPSEVVRLAEQDGIAVRARNYGMAGYVNFQESILLSILVTGGERPDLVVFYDGTNDWAATVIGSIGWLNPEGEPGTLGALQLRRALVDAGIGTVDRDEPPPALGLGGRAGAPVSADGIVEDTVAIYQQGIDLSRALAEDHGFEVVHFWQPELLTKQPLDPEERALFGGLGLDEPRYELMRRLLDRIRAALPPDVIDIADALDAVEGPVLTDNVHVNERGGRAVAEAMYEHLRPELQRLDRDLG